MIILSGLSFLISYVICYLFVNNGDIFLFGQSLNSFALICFCMSMYYNLNRRKTKHKMFIILIGFMSLCEFITNIPFLDNLFLEYPFYFIVLLCTILICKLVFTNYNKKGEYSEEGTYIAYVTPHKFIGYLLSFIYTYRTGFLIVKGKQFKFERKDKERGVYKESKHVYNKNIYYKKIEDIPIEKVRVLKGVVWSCKRNCFSIIRKIRRSRAGK